MSDIHDFNGRRFVAVDAISDAVRPVIREVIGDVLGERSATENSPWMTRKKAAEYLCISAVTLDRWRKNGDVTPIVRGKVVLYHRDQLDEKLLAA